MSYASQVLGGGSEVGDLRFDTERGSKFTRKGRVWSRCGTVYPFGPYPEAAADTGLMVNGLLSTLPGNVNVTGWATNGSGTIVAAYGDASNVLVSTNNGQTWANVAHNCGGVPVTDVVYNASVTKFVGVGNAGTTTLSACSSTTGASGWTAGGTSSVTSAAPNTARAACDGTNVLIVCQSSSTAAAATTTNGTALTARTLSSAPTSQPLIAVLPSLGATRWLIGYNGTSWNQSSTSGATAFTTVTFPSGITIVGLAAGNGVILAFAAGVTTYYTSATGATSSWTRRGLPGFAVSSNSTDNFVPAAAIGANWCSFDGTRFVTGTASSTSSAPQGLFGYSTDGLDWVTRQLAFPTTTSSMVVISANGYLATLPTGTANQDTAQYSAAWITSCDYVGKARPVNEVPTSLPITTMSKPGYVRIK